jgi:phosphoribosylaminoimidazolecarboxamide formyltransferase/IMP cyclohydrolase
MSKIDKTSRVQYRTKVEEQFAETLAFGSITFKKKMSMRYGENPGYPAAFYQEEGATGPNMSSLEVLQSGTKGLGYINVGDMDLGQRLVKKLTDIYPGENICALIKHEMPSGVAMGGDPVQVFEKAWKSDPLSNFGSVDVFNYALDKDVSLKIVEKGRNVEVVYAPSFTPDALEVLSTRKVVRVVKMGHSFEVPAQDKKLEFKRLAGGLLVQERFDSRIVSPDLVDVVSKRKASKEEIEAAIFNWTVACFTRSNAVVIGTKNKVHGIGSGQRSRIDAAEDAIRFSRRGYGPEGCVMASDAFMPFPDVVELAAKNGITAIIYPLGSIRDLEVIESANAHDIAMIVTKAPDEQDSERCFLHR